MAEERLPPTVLSKASVRGGEYAWPLADVPEVITAAQGAGLAAVGGQVQFRLQDGICELYWRSAEAGERKPGESWGEYVARSADEVLAGVRRLAVEGLVAEGLRWQEIAALHAAGADVSEFLCFVLYFAAPDSAEKLGDWGEAGDV